MIFFWYECGGADFAHELSLRAVILVEIWLRSVTARACAAIVNIAFRTSFHRLDFLAVSPFKIGDIILVIPFFVLFDFRKLINFKLLVFRRM